MRRCVTSLCILLCLTVCSLGSLGMLRRACGRMGACTDAVIVAVQAGEQAEALTCLHQLEEESAGFLRICGLFVPHDRLSPVQETLAALPAMLEQNDPEALPELEILRDRIQHIYESECPF